MSAHYGELPHQLWSQSLHVMTLGVWLGLLWHLLGSWCISSKSLSLDADLQRVWNSYSTPITFTWPSLHNHSCCPHCCQRTLWMAFRHIPRQITMVSCHPSWHSHFNICATREPQQGWLDEKDAAQDHTQEGWGEEGQVFAFDFSGTRGEFMAIDEFSTNDWCCSQIWTCTCWTACWTHWSFHWWGTLLTSCCTEQDWISGHSCCPLISQLILLWFHFGRCHKLFSNWWIIYLCWSPDLL